MARVNYVTSDSISDGVGASQVASYVDRLSRLGHSINILSFERDIRACTSMPQHYSWHPRTFRGGAYSALSRVPQTMRFLDQHPFDLVHARSDLPGLATLLGRHHPFIWDMRAFWREQRIELGSIAAGSPTDRILRILERRLAFESARIICLSDRGRKILGERYGQSVYGKVVVIPTLVDTERFTPMDERPESGKPLLLLSGAFNGFYDAPVVASIVNRFYKRNSHQLTWAGGSPASPLWNHLVNHPSLTIDAVPFSEMPALVRRSAFGLAVCRSINPAPLAAAVPTKIAEFLSSGRPVLVSSGLGDMDRILGQYGCGVVLQGRDEQSIESGVQAMTELLADEATPGRARACALAEFDLAAGVSRISEIYESLTHGPNRRAGP